MSAIVEIKTDDKLTLQTKGMSLQEIIAATEITDNASRLTIIEYGKAGRAYIKKVEGFYDLHVELAYKPWKKWCEERKEAVDIGKAIYNMAGEKVTVWDNSQRVIREAEQAELQEIAERQAAKEQKVADGKINKLLGGIIGDEKKIKVLQESLVEQVDDTERQITKNRIAQLQGQINTKQDKAENLQVNKLMPPVIPIIVQAPKIKGAREKTERVITNIDMPKLIQAIAKNPALSHLLTEHKTELKKYIGAGATIDGVTFQIIKTTKI